MYDSINIEDSALMDVKQHYLLNVAESLLIELACESDLSTEELHQKTEIIGGLLTTFEEKQYLIGMLQAREDQQQGSDLYSNIIATLAS